MQTYFLTLQYIKNELSAYYPEDEINSFSVLIFLKLENINKIQLHLKQNEPINSKLFQQVEHIVNRLKKNEPIQYILGETYFYDIKFYTAPGVLIPRPETEELVDKIIKDHEDEKNLNVLDIGTGSACIPVILGLHLNCSRIIAYEISSGAIKIAEKNRKEHNVPVKIKKNDILKIYDRKERKKFDIIVSNPPYVTLKEKEHMQSNVTDFEPHEALFVPDEDPLIFYRAIGRYASNNLKKGGRLYLEINENFGTQTFNELLSFEFNEIILKKDINGKERIITAEL